MHLNYITVIFNNIYRSHNCFVEFHQIETEISLTQKFWKKLLCVTSGKVTYAICRVILIKSWHISMYVRISLTIKFQEILCIRSQGTFPAKILSYTRRQTFSRNYQIVFKTFQNVKILQKLAVKNFYETNNFFYLTAT